MFFTAFLIFFCGSRANAPVPVQVDARGAKLSALTGLVFAGSTIAFRL